MDSLVLEMQQLLASGRNDGSVQDLIGKKIILSIYILIILFLIHIVVHINLDVIVIDKLISLKKKMLLVQILFFAHIFIN